MSTIERRMDLLLRSQAFLTVYGAAHEYAEARIHLQTRDTTEAAIVKEWNAAVNELRIIRYTARDDNDGECEMTVEITWVQLARIEVAIKAMGGVLLRDEESFQSLLVEMEGN